MGTSTPHTKRSKPMADSPPPRLVTFEEIQRVLRDIRPDVLSDAISAGAQNEHRHPHALARWTVTDS